MGITMVHLHARNPQTQAPVYEKESYSLIRTVAYWVNLERLKYISGVNQKEVKILRW